MNGRGAIVGLTALMISMGGVSAAAATETVPDQRTPGASQQARSFYDSLRVQQIGDKVLASWDPSPRAVDGGYYTVRVVYVGGRGGSDYTELQGYRGSFAGDQTSGVLNTSAEQWGAWWQDANTRPNYIQVQLWASSADGKIDYANGYATLSGIPVIPPAPNGVTPSRPTTTQNIESSLDFQGIGRDWQTPVRKGENITIDALLTASAGSSQKTVELWWYPDANLMKPQRIGNMTMYPEPLPSSNWLSPRQNYWGHLDLKATESGHVVGVYKASQGQTMDAWGTLTRNVDTTVKSHGTTARVIGASGSRVTIQGTQKRVVKKSKSVVLKAKVQNLKGVKRVKVLDGVKVLGEAHLNKKGEWIFNYKARVGTHRITFKAIGSSKSVKSPAVEIVGRR